MTQIYLPNKDNNDHMNRFDFEQMKKKETDLRNAMQTEINAVIKAQNPLSPTELQTKIQTILLDNVQVPNPNQVPNNNDDSDYQELLAQVKDLLIERAQALPIQIANACADAENLKNQLDNNKTPTILTSLVSLLKKEPETKIIYDVGLNNLIGEDPQSTINIQATANNMAKQASLDHYLNNPEKRAALLDKLANASQANPDDLKILAQLKEKKEFRAEIIQKLAEPAHTNTNSVLDQIVDTHRTMLGSLSGYITQTRQDINAAKKENINRIQPLPVSSDNADNKPPACEPE